MPLNYEGNALTFNPTGSRLLVRLANSSDKIPNCEFVLFDTDKDEPVAKWSLPREGGTATFSLDEGRFLDSGYKGIKVLDMARPGNAMEKLIDRGLSTKTALTPDKRWLASSLNKELRVWDIGQKKFGPAFDAAFEPDLLQAAGNDLFISVGNSKEPPASKHLDVWDRAQGKRVASIQPPAGFMFAGGIDGAANGSFAVVRLKPLPGAGTDDNVIEIYRLPKPSSQSPR